MPWSGRGAVGGWSGASGWSNQQGNERDGTVFMSVSDDETKQCALLALPWPRDLGAGRSLSLLAERVASSVGELGCSRGCYVTATQNMTCRGLRL